MMKAVLLIFTSLFFLGCSTVHIFDTTPSYGSMTVHFINVGQGDSTFIHLSSGENILIDTGSPAGGPNVTAYLQILGVHTIDHLILTHPHDDHIGGIFSLLSEMEVKRFYDNGFSNFKSDLYGEYVKAVRHNLSDYHILQAGEKIMIGSLSIDVLNPLLPPSGRINEDSIVVRLIFGDTRILLTGDMGQPGEQRLLNHGTELESGIIKIAHHGEKDACSEDFLRKVSPESAIISVGKDNRYGRPHPELLKRLEMAVPAIYRTDENGTVRLMTDGRTYSIKTEK